MKRLALFLIVAVALSAIAVACTPEKEIVEVEKQVVVVKEVIKEVEVPGETVVVEKEVIKEVVVEVPGETVVVEKEVIKEVPVEKVVTVEKEVIKEVEVPGETVTVVKEVIKEVKVPGETVIVEKEVIKEVEVPGETVIVEKEVVKVVTREGEAAEKVLTIRSTLGALQALHLATGASPTMGMIYSTLVSADPVELRWSPNLAERWEIAPDASSYTFHLRKNALWHDGTPVTTKDVAFTIKSYGTLDTGSIFASQILIIKGAQDYQDGKTDEIAGIVVVDDYTIRFDMEQPNVTFLEILNFHGGKLPATILPEHILGPVPPKEIGKHPFWTNTRLGAGPYKFVRYVPDQFTELEANPEYYFGRPKIDRIIHRDIPSRETAQIAMQRGELQLDLGPPPPPDMVQAFITDPRFDVIQINGSVTTQYAWNSRDPSLADPRLHKAISHAIDRKKMVDKFFSGGGSVKNVVLIHSWYQKPEWDELYPYDPVKARALLEEAGWDFDREVEIIMYGMESPEDQAILAAEQAYMRAVGFKANIQTIGIGSWAEKYYTNQDYEMARGNWGAFGDPSGFLQFHHTVGGSNAPGYSSPETDIEYKIAANTVDRVERTKLYQKIVERFLEDMPYTSLWVENQNKIKSRSLFMPALGDIPPATSPLGMHVYRTFMGSDDFWHYHQEAWDLTQ